MRSILVIIIIIVGQSILFSIPALHPVSIFDEMSYRSVLKIDIEVDMVALTGNIRNEDKHKATLKFKDKNGNDQTWKIKLELRGKFRRMKCSEMPPLKLNFDKDDLSEAGLATFDDMKLVTHCIEDKQEAKTLLLKEYLAYKMYNQLTIESYRVQILKVTYKDTVTGKKKKQWAFLIEDTAQLRARIGAKKYKKNGTIEKELNTDQMRHMAVFQYMIGNADWDLTGPRNVKLLKQNNKVIAIPYDFDFSGLVNPPYAMPNINYGLTTTTQRVYLGDQKDVEFLDGIFEKYYNHKNELIDIINDFKPLNLATRQEMIAYIESFYQNMGTLNFPVKTDKVKRDSIINK